MTSVPGSLSWETPTRRALQHRWAWAEIDLAAVAHNIEVMATAAQGAQVWAVVKADAYGHRVLPTARGALAAGAEGLCVALVQEALEVREAGIEAPILVLTEQPVDQIDAALSAKLQLVVYNPAMIDAISAAARRASVIAPVHLHIDTGMNRVGAPVGAATGLMQRIHADEHLRLAGTMTHFACADTPDEPATTQQLERFVGVLDAARAAGIDTGRVHAANSAATLAFPDAHFDMVRVGIAIYGISPGSGVDDLAADLRPVLSLKARVSHVRRVDAGEHVSYGWRYRVDRPTTLATLPIGYADGVRRGLSSGRDGSPGRPVLIDGRRHPIVGVVTMDQTIIDVGDMPVAVGDEAVLIGSQGDDHIRAEDWAEWLDTIGYEIVCGIGDRVPRSILTTNDAVSVGAQS